MHEYSEPFPAPPHTHAHAHTPADYIHCYSGAVWFGVILQVITRSMVAHNYIEKGLLYNTQLTVTQSLPYTQFDPITVLL